MPFQGTCYTAQRIPFSATIALYFSPDIFSVNQPTPAIVSQREVQRLPRLALILLCAAYIIPGLIGRAPWRNGDLITFGYINALANNSTSWLSPELMGVAAKGGLLPYWFGAAFVKALPFLDAPVAARIPFLLTLIAIFALTWFTCYYLARTDSAQPIAFAFGGEARPNDYARAIADGALLALMASFGLLQTGHETSVELMQMGFIILFLFGFAIAPFKRWAAWLSILIALPALALSDAPFMALILGVIGCIICFNSEYEKARSCGLAFLLSLALAVMVMSLTHTWTDINIHIKAPGQTLRTFLKNTVWFTWPVWLFALWALWQWRYLWRRRHISGPLVVIVLCFIASISNGVEKSYLLYALPCMAILAAFSMPTLKRSMAALVDWFALFLFTLLIIAIWVYWYAMLTGHPEKQAAQVLRLIPGFKPEFEWLPFMLALLATLGWLWLVRWRTGRHPSAIWKGMVLSAGGVTVCWFMLMTLGLKSIDYARSYTAWTEKVIKVVQQDGEMPSCLSVLDLEITQIAAWSWQPGVPLKTESADCPYLIANSPPYYFIPQVDTQRWVLDPNGVIIRPNDRTRQDRVLIYKRIDN